MKFLGSNEALCNCDLLSTPSLPTEYSYVIVLNTKCKFALDVNYGTGIVEAHAKGGLFEKGDRIEVYGR